MSQVPWLMATAWHDVDLEHFHHHSRFYWTVLLEQKEWDTGAGLVVTVTSNIKIYFAPLTRRCLWAEGFVQCHSVHWLLTRLSVPYSCSPDNIMGRGSNTGLAHSRQSLDASSLCVPHPPSPHPYSRCPFPVQNLFPESYTASLRDRHH